MDERRGAWEVVGAVTAVYAAGERQDFAARRALRGAAASLGTYDTELAW